MVQNNTSTYTSFGYPNQYDPSDWGGGTFSYYFEAALLTTAGTASAQLYNDTDASAISSSVVNTTNLTTTLVRSSSLTMPTTAKDLDIEIKNSATNTTSIDGGWLIIDVTNLPATPNSPTSLQQYRNNGSTTISNGSWTSDGITSNIIFSFSMSSPESTDTLTPQVEVEPNGTSFTGTPNYSGSSASYSGTPVTGTVTATGLSNCIGYHWQAFVVNTLGTDLPTVFNATNPNFSVASTAPTASTIYDGSVNGSETSTTTSITIVNANWASFTDSCSGLPANPYRVAIGTTSGGMDTLSYTATGVTTGSPNTFSISSLTLTAGKTYYISIQATNNAGLSTIATSSGITVTPTISFSLSVNSLAMPPTGNIVLNNATANISNTVTLNVSTNAVHGFAITVQDSNGGMRSQAANYTINSVGSGPTTLSSEGFGMGVYGSPSAGTVASQYQASINGQVGSLTTSPQTFWSNTSPQTSSTSVSPYFNLYATPASPQGTYTDTVTFSATSTY